MSRKPKNIPPEVKEAPTEEPLEIFKDNFEKVVEAEKEKANSFMTAWNKIMEVRS